MPLKTDHTDPQCSTLYLYDEIGPANWGLIDAMAVIEALAACGGKPVNLRINSPGGDVFEGLAIYNALQRHAPGVTCHVDALAASSASIVALGGKKLCMAKNAMLMIHNAWTFAMGNAEELRKCADTLEKVDGQLCSTYCQKSGMKPDECKQLMDAETWLTADEALAKKLCDEISSEAGVAAKLPAKARWRNTPRSLLDAAAAAAKAAQRPGIYSTVATLRKRMAEVRSKFSRR